MPVAHAVLGVLARGDCHGYELRRALEAELGAEWRVDFGQLYRVLARLERAGWVRVRRQERAQGPTRKVRTITAAGRRELARWSAGTHAPAPRREAVAVQRRLAPHTDAEAPLRAAGSDDAVLDLLAASLGDSAGAPLAVERIGSLAGLWALREGRAEIAGIHLRDADSGEYNVPFVKHLLLEEAVVLVTLARREQGLLLAAGNPLRIRGVRDLGRRRIRLVNRQRGAGTRLLLRDALRAARLDPTTVDGWERAVPTHAAVATAIATGSADAGPGTRAAAVGAGLDFLPLGEERYDLVIPRALFESPRLHRLQAALHAADLRRAAGALPGYDVSRLGHVAARVDA